MRHLLPLAALGAALAPAQAQSPTALLREGDALTGGPAGHTVTGFNVPAINSVGGYSVLLTSDDGVATLSQAWGSPVTGAAAPDIFLTEQTVGSLEQTSWETLSYGIGDGGELGYSSSGNGGPVGGFDSVWRDLTPLMVEGDPIAALPGKFWRFGSRPKSLSDGTVVFVGGITSTAGGSTESYGLFADDQPVLLGGDVLPGLPGPLTPTGSAFSFDFQYSRNGSHYLVEVTMDGFTTADDNAMVLSGSGLDIGGSLVREGSPVPASAGGIGGENWDNFDFVAVLNDGQYLFTGDTDNADTAVDEFIVKNGTIIKREGDTVGGLPLVGGVLGATMNENGDVAYIWDVDDNGTNREVLVLNDQIVLAEFDTVDVDGDGVADPGNTLADFESGSQLCLADDGSLYFIADVDTGGGNLVEVFYVIEGSGGGIGTPYCTATPNSSGSAAAMSAAGSDSVAANNLVLVAQPVPANQNGLFYYGPEAGLAPFGNGFRCVNPGSTGFARLAIESASSGGVLSHSLDNTAPPTATTLITAGSTWFFQAWFRDPAAGGAFFNLSDGLEITFQP